MILGAKRGSFCSKGGNTMTERRENATKRRIRETATRLFRERSFDAVTLSDICEASGVNKHTFYYYFKSKDELLEQYYDLPWTLSATEVTDILTSEDYVAQLWRIMRKFVDFVEHSGVTIMRQILVKNLNENVGTFHPHQDMKEMCRLQASIIEKGQRAGQFQNTADPLSLVMLLQQIVHSTGLVWVVERGSFDFGERIRFLFEVLLNVAAAFREMTEYETCFFSELRGAGAPPTL